MGLNRRLSDCYLFALQPGKQKKKFSSFFKSLVIELDKDLYGPDNHLVEVSSKHRGGTTHSPAEFALISEIIHFPDQ